MKIPVHIAEKLLKLSNGEQLPSSSAKHALINELVIEEIIVRKGRIQKTLLVSDSKALHTYMQNNYSIKDLQEYVEVLKKEEVTRTELVAATSDSKQIGVRSFKGFLLNCYEPIEAKLNGNQLILKPEIGTFQFIYDFEQFTLPTDITVVGMENPTNFRHIEKQKYLFRHIKPLFVSRYPQNQSKDLIKWLQIIPNEYVHFGDFDIAGIGIYLNEFKKYLEGKSKFFVPENIDELIKKFGNRNRYDNQKINFDNKAITETELLRLIEIIHRRRKGLDQEILIRE